MSRRNRNGAGTTYVNNVRGPTSALTSFLNERGIRRANPAPAPAVSNTVEQQQDEENQSTPTTPSSSQTTRTARLTRGRTITTATGSASISTSRSESIDAVNTSAGDVEEEEENGDDNDDGVDLVPISLSLRTTRSTRVRVAVAASTSSASSSSSKAKAAASKDADSAAAGPSKKRRKKDASDDENDEDFHDITGYVSRSSFSHKGRMPQGSNRIEFCSRCRARFTIKAGITPAMDEDDGGMLCPTCAGATEPALTPIPRSKPAKRARRKQQKAEIESQVPSLQDLCIQKIANYIEDVEAFGDISDFSLNRICKIICRNRSLNPSTIQLFLDPRHVDLTLYDCTNITAEGFQSIAQFCPNLRSLKLKMCGRIDDSAMAYYTEHLTDLSSLSLVGPILITEGAYIKLFETVGERFERFEIKHAARFSLKALKALCDNCPNLTHLRLSDLNQMDDEWMEPISNLTKLRSLRLRNPEHECVSTEPVMKLLQAVGSGLEELELKGCIALEDRVLTDAVLPSCVRLERLNIAGCEEFTTEGIVALFTEWKLNRGLTYLNLENCVMLKDEALVAIAAHSGATLEDFGIKGLDELTKEGLAAMEQCLNLKTLDVSWCRAMDDDMMERLLESSPKLEKIIVWGDHRLTECCPSRKGLKVVGREGDYMDLRFM